MKGLAVSSNTTGPRPGAAEAFVSRAPWLDSSGIDPEHRGAPRAHLTPRQREVLSLLCEGLPNKLICRRLNISAGTVKIHISCILRELGVTSRLQAVLSAHRCGLIGDAAPGSAEPGHAPEPAVAA